MISTYHLYNVSPLKVELHTHSENIKMHNCNRTVFNITF